MNVRDFARRRARIEYSDMPSKKRRKAMEHLLREAGASLVVIGRQHVGYRLPTGEVVCIKVRYRHQADAWLALERIKNAANDNGHAPVREYACPYCKGWHLTSQQKMRKAA